MASATTILDQLGEDERTARDRPVDIDRVRSILAKDTAEALRKHLVDYYRTIHGSAHAFVRHLDADPYVNYYRMDSAPALQYTYTDGVKPLIVFVKSFVDDPPDKPAREWQSAEEKWVAYFGGDIDAVAEAAARERLLLTAGAPETYRGPFMRQVFSRLARDVPENAWPVYANVVQSASATLACDASKPVLRAYKKLAKHMPPQAQHVWHVDGQLSRLPSVTTSTYLDESFRWFQVCLPDPGWEMLEPAVDAAARERGKNGSLQALMETAWVFRHIFAAPLYYSRGPSCRVGRHDLRHWRQVLERTTAPVLRRIDGLGRQTRIVHRFTGAVDFAAGLLELVDRVPTILAEIDERIQQVVPACLQGDRGEAIREAWERVLDAAPDEASAPARLRTQVQRFCLQNRHEEAGALVGEINEALANLHDLPQRLDLAKQECRRAYVNAGATITTTLFPNAKPFHWALDLGWQTLDRVRGWMQERGNGLAPINPNFQVGLDVLEVEGGGW